MRDITAPVSFSTFTLGVLTFKVFQLIQEFIIALKELAAK